MLRPRRQRSALDSAQRAQLLRQFKKYQRICNGILAKRPALPARLPTIQKLDLEMQQVCATFLRRICEAGIRRLQDGSR